MTENNDSTKNNAPQGQVLEIPKEILPIKLTYDVDRLKHFLNTVFDIDNMNDDENILVWKMSGNSFGLPEKSYTKCLADLKRATRPHRLYFGTSTTGRDEEGALRNKKDLFKHLYVLVLDDIGTKVPLDKIPADFQPTYIIESSKGNYQYGYVLDEPLSVREEAEALVQLVYEAGYSDAGGKMATKLVRLPEGVNGKNGDGRNFRVNLKELHEDRLWSPTDILDKLDLGVTWQEVVDDAEGVAKKRAHKNGGSSPWSPLKAELPSLGGVVDEVAEWLYAEGHVKQETNEWLTVKCPWSDTHTAGGADWASYSPLGWGNHEWAKHRTFHCFHEHCQHKHSDDFLDFVSTAGGPDMPVTERAYELTSRYVYDPSNSGVWDIKREGQPFYMKIDAFNYMHPFKVSVPSSKAKIPETALFKLSKSRVNVEGVTYDPTTPAKIVTTQSGINQINTYTQPDWGDGDHVEADVETFTNFIEYLIPDKKSREYYLDWLAAKAQSMAFRGPAILMIAQSQGTGRSTLANMIAQLFGAENIERVPFERLSGGGGQFNDWIVKPIIITDETLALGNDDNFYKVYERLKELIDTTPQEVRVNPKFGMQRFQTTYSSFMLFSNHANAMKIADNDRRIYVLDNAVRPASPEFFGTLNDWIDKKVWARSVWRWLRKREVDVAKLVAPPTKNKAKDDLIRASKQPVDVAIEAVLDGWPTNTIAFFQVKNILAHSNMALRLKLKDPSQMDKIMLRSYQNYVIKIPDVGKVRVGSSTVRVSFIANREGVPRFDPNEVVQELPITEHDKILAAVEDALTEHDF